MCAKPQIGNLFMKQSEVNVINYNPGFPLGIPPSPTSLLLSWNLFVSMHTMITLHVRLPTPPTHFINKGLYITKL